MLPHVCYLVQRNNINQFVKAPTNKQINIVKGAQSMSTVLLRGFVRVLVQYN